LRSGSRGEEASFAGGGSDADKTRFVEKKWLGKILQRYAHTLRHLKPWQVAGRLVAPLRRRLATWRLPMPPTRLRGTLQPRTAFLQHEPWNTRTDVLEGRFCFLNVAFSD